MKKPLITLSAALLLAACGPAEESPEAGAAPPEAEAAADAVADAVAETVAGANVLADEALFIPEDFAPPELVEAEGFTIKPLGPELVDIDFEAYMSSIDHLQRTFTRSTNWPREGITDAEAMLDMETEQARFEARSSFAYAVLTPDGSRERGCVYVYPGSKPGYDAEVRLWVTQAEFDAGFDAELYGWVQQWIAEDWPFETVAYPGRGIDWESWEALPDV